MAGLGFIIGGFVILVCIVIFALYIWSRNYHKPLTKVGGNQAKESFETNASNDKNISVPEDTKVVSTEKVRTTGQIFGYGTPDLNRVDDRVGRCKDCGTSMNLSQAKEYKSEWDRHYAFFYYCPKCNSSPNNSNFYTGQLIGRDNKEIIDQVEKEE
jgi:hypothetical protein